ncbi:LysR family transcriptional regulator [Desulforamulus ruminis]|uniref:Regulatory protein LysR n=1 Tax=Desulforamulus ruminis (strain ATCC 23193 / DSM 2154 / NCIMB 8452 / DL) TaxID=696281 RepID=F6DSE5_DESRL|nr:LysR family transcriptional regulator [Desulforamulus ruminis]AEG59924.1 regulatory protein LysR [Desulforamulus ruminis DSM 2154]
MDIQHLNYLVDIAKTESISLTAKRFFISQQGLSQIIQKLENDLNVTLLHRNRHGVTLTDAGKAVVEQALEIVQKYEELLQVVQPLTNTNVQSIKGHLSISAAPNVSYNYLPEVLDSFNRKFPQVDVQVEEKQHFLEIIQQINDGVVDIGLVILPDYSYQEQILRVNATFEKISENPLLACVAKTSVLAKKKIITIKELSAHPIALYSHENYLSMIKHMFKDLSSLNISVKTSYVEVYKKAILDRKAVGLTSFSDFRLLDDEAIITVPIENSFKLIYGCFINSLNPVTEGFLSILKLVAAHKLTGKRVHKG